jgi:K+/H+ antiporter YhaU regulatory subunit KhtT
MNAKEVDESEQGG